MLKGDLTTIYGYNQLLVLTQIVHALYGYSQCTQCIVFLTIVLLSNNCDSCKYYSFCIRLRYVTILL